MAWLILGVVLFLGPHSVRIFADDWRTRTIEKVGDKAYKGMYTVLTLIGFYALIVGYADARMQPIVIWQPPIATRHVSVLLMLFASILLVAAHLPGNHLKLRLGHPMVLSVKVWALAHLLANGNLADLLLFGTFLLWSVLVYKSSRARDRAQAQAQAQAQLQAQASGGSAAAVPVAKMPATIMAVVVGALVWIGITFYLHAIVVGVSPLG
jgi:uncharacterized membrane protein